MIADNFEKVERDSSFHDDSYFEVIFEDGSIRTEKDLNWSQISEQKVVGYKNGNRAVFLSVPKIKTIKIIHGELSTEIEVPEDCRVFQSVHGNSTYIPGMQTIHSTVGRFVGLVKDDRIIEERFLNAVEGNVIGFRE